MKNITHLILSGLLLFALAFTTGCKTETKVAEEPIAAASYSALMVTHHVANFDTFKTVYLANDSLRAAYGITRKFLGRGTEDTSLIVSFSSASDLAKAKELAASPEIKTRMAAATVTDEPTFAYLNVIRESAEETPIMDRVLISHKVKDFDAWLKVYDAEGKTKRAEYGIIDRGLARGADDPNTVYIAFAIADKAKAMERMQSEDLKKTMTDAGVEGPPNMIFYTLIK